MDLKLKKFDPTQMKSPCGGPIEGIFHRNPVIFIIGKRCAGKTWLAKDLINKMKNNVDNITIFKSTPIKEYNIKNNRYQTVHNHIEKFDPVIIEKIVDAQDLKMQYFNKNQKTLNYLSYLLLMDDALHDTNWVNNVHIKQLFLNGRHLRATLMITMQYPLSISPSLRSSIDYIFILRENNIDNRRRLFKQYAYIFPTFDIFCQVMNNCTTNYDCLVIDNTTVSNKIEDNVYWYKAEEVNEIRIGYTDEEISAIKKIELWFLECKYNPKYKYCRNKVLENYNEMYDIPPLY